MAAICLVFVTLVIVFLLGQAVLRRYERHVLAQRARQAWAAYTPLPETVRAVEILGEAANEGRANIDELAEVFYQVASYPSTADYGYYLKLKNELVDRPGAAPARWALSDDGEIIDLDSEVK